jgi:hypothetical protein
VNPLFHFKGSEEQRQKVIREQLEEINELQSIIQTRTTYSKAVSCDQDSNLINLFIISILFLSNAVALGLAIGFNSLYSGILLLQGIRKTQLLFLFPLLISNIDSFWLFQPIVINLTCPVPTNYLFCHS